MQTPTFSTRNLIFVVLVGLALVLVLLTVIWTRPPVVVNLQKQAVPALSQDATSAALGKKAKDDAADASTAADQAAVSARKAADSTARTADSAQASATDATQSAKDAARIAQGETAHGPFTNKEKASNAKDESLAARAAADKAKEKSVVAEKIAADALKKADDVNNNQPVK
jgi:hypothetical protein